MGFVWQASEQQRPTIIGKFMDLYGITSLDELLTRARDDIGWFWDAAMKDLEIEFAAPYSQVVDTSKGNAWAKWFTGGTISLIRNCVDKWAERTPTAPALLWEGEDGASRKLSYREVRQLTNVVAEAIKELGVRVGDTVAIFMPPSPEAAVVLLACARAGAIAVPLFSGYSANAVAARLNDAGAKLLFTADGFFRRGSFVAMKEVADVAVEKVPSLQTVVVWPRTGRSKVPMTAGRDIYWNEIIAESGTFSDEPRDPETPFLLCYTSGTTGKPKGAVLVYASLAQFAVATAYHLDLRQGEVHFWPTDLGWIMGPLLIIGTLVRGGTALLYEGFPGYPNANRMWELVERHRVNVLGVSPSLIRGLIAAGSAPQSADLSTLRILSGSGEPWNPEAWTWLFEKVGAGRCPVINLSGGTEVGGAFLSPLPITPLKPCTLGHPALGMDVDIFDSEGRSTAAGAVGELVCKKPWPGMTRGLWRDNERYIETYWKSWPGIWRHGDWASRDEDGLWYLHGRSDDTLNIGGKRLGPAEVESVLTQHPSVAEAAAIALPHPVKGESLWCFVMLKPQSCGDDTLADQLKLSVERELGKAFRPEQIVFTGDLPRTRTAKILRRVIRATVLDKDAGDISGLENPEAIRQIKAALPRNLPGSPQ